MEAARREGRKPYFLPGRRVGAAGLLGYVRCVHEMAQQLGRETKVDVFSAVSSAGTHAGLMLGKALFGLDNWRMVGVPVSDSLDYFRREIRQLINQTIERSSSTSPKRRRRSTCSTATSARATRSRSPRRSR
jgi:1-aminocyclopropane-1-carboxylate deaminase/D-cysteine desulfhydrase-like pyridoxal-dependent ACC family enzyme